MGAVNAWALIEWSDEELEEAGIDKARLIKIIRHLKSASDLMEGTGLQVYGESGSGYLIHESRPEHKQDTRRMESDFGAIIADVGMGFDGGAW